MHDSPKKKRVVEVEASGYERQREISGYDDGKGHVPHSETPMPFPIIVS